MSLAEEENFQECSLYVKSVQYFVTTHGNIQKVSFNSPPLINLELTTINFNETIRTVLINVM